MRSIMFFLRSLLLLSSLTLSFALQLNLYTSIGQVRDEIVFENGYFQTYFTNQEYHAIVPGTIDFSGQRMIEQDFYNSNEQLRNADVYLRTTDCGSNVTIRAKLINPYSFLIRHDSSRYAYVSRDRIEFTRDPTMDGMILSVRLDETTTTIKTNMTYLTRGLWWTPRYEVIVIDDLTATLRALADITNEHEVAYNVTHSQLITGGVPLVTNTVRAPPSAETQRVEFMSASMADMSTPISNRPDSTNFGSYSYNLTRPFLLRPKSIKTFPFLSTQITCNYTLETSTYLSIGVTSGLFQRMFTLQSSEFLPAGIATFYLASSGLTLGQGRLPDTSAQSEQKITLGNDPDVRYSIVSVITTTRQTPTYGQDLTVNITISNRKNAQLVRVTLSINGGYRNTNFIIKSQSSSSITIAQDPITPSTLIVRATIKPNQEESCACTVSQSN